MRRLFFVLTIGLGSCRAQDLPSPARFAKVDAWLEDNARAMGGKAVLVISKNGSVVYTKAVTEGWSAGTRQPIASCSKWLSAALVMTFIDEGKLSLDDTVGKYLPVLTQHGKGGITVRQCLSHLTGIKEPPMRQSVSELRRIGSMDEAVELIAAMPVEGAPGSVFHYSNAGLQLAGAILEKIGGESFERLFAERIARPLEMTNTDFGRRAVAMPAGGASSTAEDYIHFLEMILNRGNYHGKRVLSERSVKEMQVNRLGPDVRIAYSPAQNGGMDASNGETDASNGRPDASNGRPGASNGASHVGYGYGEWIMGEAVSSPGLFGSFPWVENKHGYCAFLMTVNLNNKGRQQREMELVRLVDEVL